MFLKHSEVTILNCRVEGSIGTAIHALEGIKLTVCGSYFIRNKGTSSGGVILVKSGSLILDGSIPNVFNHNSDTTQGGTICCVGCSLKMTGNNTFHNNSVAYLKNPSNGGNGGALYINTGEQALQVFMIIRPPKVEPFT